MPEPTNKKLYNQIKKMADDKFASKSGIYKSSWIVNEYKKRGGMYSGTRPRKSGLKRWYEEEWVDLNRPIRKGGKIVGYEQCGRTGSNQRTGRKSPKYPLCRPTYRITEDTPRTYKELSKKSISKAKRDKAKIEGSGNIQFQRGGQRIYVAVPVNVKKWCEYALKLQKMGFMGNENTNWTIAKRLSKEEYITIRDLHKIRKWFSANTSKVYPQFREWERENRPKTKKWKGKISIIDWIVWGGNAGFKWVNSRKMVYLLNDHFGTSYTRRRIKKDF